MQLCISFFLFDIANICKNYYETRKKIKKCKYTFKKRVVLFGLPASSVFLYAPGDEISVPCV